MCVSESRSERTSESKSKSVSQRISEREKVSECMDDWMQMGEWVIERVVIVVSVWVSECVI